MALPVIDVPVYDLKIPSTNQTVKVRPFSVKEEKLLFMAVEGGKMDEITSTVKQVINNCVMSGKLEVDKLPFFDIDYAFIFLRAKSIGATQDISLTCKNEVDGHECGNVFDTKLDMGKVEVIKDKDIKDDIKLDKDKGVKMRYPTYSVIKALDNAKTDMDKKTLLIVNSIDYIYDKNGTYSHKDHTKEELVDFVEKLTEENYKKLEYFVDNFPVFLAKLDVSCPKCSYEHHVRYSDFYDFFT